MSRGSAPTTEALGAAVAQLRARRGMRQKDLAAASSLDTSYLSGIERGHRNPTWAMLGRICVALELPLSALVRMAEDLERERAARPSAAQGTFSARAKRGAGVAKKARNVWTVPVEGGGWGNRYEDSNRILDKGARKAEVESQGRDRARKEKSEHVVLKKDGAIGRKNSYGHDPRSTRG